MMQYADLGTICEDKNKANPDIVKFLTHKLTEETNSVPMVLTHASQCVRESLALFFLKLPTVWSISMTKLWSPIETLNLRISCSRLKQVVPIT